MKQNNTIHVNAFVLYLFLIGIFCLPLNSDPPLLLKFLGEYRSDSIALFFLLGTSLFICRDIILGRFIIPYKNSIYFIFLLFFSYLFVGFILNIQEIKSYSFKNTDGVTRFIKQIGSLFIIGVLFFYFMYNTFVYAGAKKAFILIRKFMFYSLIITTIYCSLEILIIYLNFRSLIPILELFDYFPFIEPRLDYFGDRLSGPTYEPPALGTYLITIAGFMFSYILSGKRLYKFIPFMLVVFLALLSKSRAAFVIVLLQVLIGFGYVYFTNHKMRYWLNRILFLSSFILLILIIYYQETVYQIILERVDDLNFLNRSQENELSISNKSRLGIQYANLQVFKHNPILGVGWGQQSYEGLQYIPTWSKFNNWEYTYKYLNYNHSPFPPGYNLFIRLLAETGIIGFSLFLIFIGNFFIALIKSHRAAKLIDKTMLLALLITTAGAIVNWLQTDSIRSYGFWLCLALFLVYKNYKNQRNEVAV